MGKFIYRVLRENEICDKGLGMGIYGKTFNMQNYQTKTLGDALDNITTHIAKGNSYQTEFISCSNDFCLDLKKYASEQLDLRPYLAIVFNHDKSTLESEYFDVYKERLDSLEEVYSKIKSGLTFEEYGQFIKQDKLLTDIYKALYSRTDLESKSIINDKIRLIYHPRNILRLQTISIKQSNIKKLVIDASRNIYNDEIYKFFFENGLIFNKNGFQKEKINQWEYGTARNSSEVIVLNHINEKDFKILNPLQYDVLYCLCYNFAIPYHNIKEDIIEQIDILKEENYKIIMTMLDEEEKIIFEQMYILRKPIYALVETLTEFNKIIEIKKRILKKCIELLNRRFNKNYGNSYIFTIEQSIELNKSPVVKIEDGKILRKTL